MTKISVRGQLSDEARDIAKRAVMAMGKWNGLESERKIRDRNGVTQND